MEAQSQNIVWRREIDEINHVTNDHGNGRLIERWSNLKFLTHKNELYK